MSRRSYPVANAMTAQINPVCKRERESTTVRGSRIRCSKLIVRRRCFVCGMICVEEYCDRWWPWLQQVVAPLELGQRRLVRTWTSQGLGTGVAIVEHSVNSTTRTVAVGGCLGSDPRGYCTRGTTRGRVARAGHQAWFEVSSSNEILRISTSHCGRG